MAKKFTGDNAGIPEEVDLDGTVSDTMDTGKDSTKKNAEASAEEKLSRSNKMKTQGKKGCKLHRINLSVTEENYDFLHVLSEASGRSVTRTINDIIELYRSQKRNKEFYETVKDQVEKNKFWEGEKWQ